MELTTEALREIMPLCAHLEMNLLRASPDEVVGSMEWAESTTTMGGTPGCSYDADTVGADAADWVA